MNPPNRRASDQETPGPPKLFSETFGDFKIEVKLRSASKAARNDPKRTPPQREKKRKLSPQSSDGEPRKSVALSLAAHEAVCNPSSEHNADEFLHQEQTPLHTGDAGNPQGDDSHEIEAVGLKRVKKKIDVGESQEDNSIVFGQHDESDCDDEDDEHEDPDEFDDDGEHVELDGLGSPFDPFDEFDDEDEDRSENDPDFEFGWLEPIDVVVLSTADLDEHGEPKWVAFCEAKLIRRNQMRGDFYGEMEQPSRETSMLAFGLFDRYGRLRSEVQNHPVIRGTGIWGQEMDYGDMLLIEEVFVKQEYRKQGFGRRMVESLLTLARQKTLSFFAFVWPTALKVHDIRQEYDSLKDDAAQDQMEAREHDRAVMFCRSLGFRRVGSTIWFGMASDNEHPSHQLTSREDYDPPEPPLTALHSLLSPFQQISDPHPPSRDQMLGRQPPEYPDFLGVLQNCMQQNAMTDACWTSKDKYGNTVLHLAVSIFDVRCVEWILNQGFGSQLLQLRNYQGETPLELLQFKLEKLRTQRAMNGMILPVSDQFQRHDASAVRCLTLLQALGSAESVAESQSPIALLRMARAMARGCTCGRCLKGFLSPRMSHALLCQAEIGCDTMNGLGLFDGMSGPEWVEEFQDWYLEYLPTKVLNNLKTNKSMRQGFSNLWGHVATCLRKAKVPDETHVLDVVEDEGEWPPHTRNFFQRGGTVEAVFLAICKNAMSQDEWTGDGSYQEMFEEDIANLPRCRNDHEFGYVSGKCGYRRISVRSNVDIMGNRLDEDGNRIDLLL